MVRPHKNWLLIILTLGAVGTAVLLAPRQASAACGDYLTTRAQELARSHSGTSQSHYETNSNSQRHESAPLNKPCQGPRCGNAFPPVLPTPSVPDRVWPEQLAILASITAGIPSFQVWHVYDTGLFKSRSEEDGIFHPPRSVSL